MPEYKSRYRIRAYSIEMIGLPGSSSIYMSGSLQVDGIINAFGVTSSLYGTSSWALNALTASFVSGSIASASYALSASYAASSSIALSSSYALSASYAPGSTPASPDGGIQFNLGGVFGANSFLTFDNGQSAFSNGELVSATGYASHAEGFQTTASADHSHAEGFKARTQTTAIYSHAEGHETTAQGAYSHVEGFHTTASGQAAHAEGYYTFASGNYSHAEGSGSVASGSYSHAQGNSTIALGNSQATFGRFNVADNSSLFIIGNGLTEGTRSNLALFRTDGMILSGSLVSTGGFTGSLQGTASWAQQVISASYAATASLLLGAVVSASYALTSSYAETASYVPFSQTQKCIGFTGAQVNNTVSTMEVSGSIMSMSLAGWWDFVYIITHESAATSTGALWTVSGSGLTVSHVDITILASTAFTDRSTQHLFGFNQGQAFTTSAATTANRVMMKGTIEVLTPGTIAGRFASEVGSSAITIVSASGWYKRRDG